ncbi:DUF4124 domain-containing protein [Parahaliea maris]|uniref:DUF4124 domain-containing protein n=1 Tax=Parahaliea maris TaxID=2716870 RepID=A0A5C9A3L2_9GAMM|nr:DUF4124 domain-containing protein [Parahaliea maris]TXS95358.1 DUF4124 domain-containing protein [Parahaliea maris]
MFIRMTVIGLLLSASVAQAKVYKCVDPATGKTTFTDVACASNKASDDQVRVKPQNFGASGHRSQASSQQRVWRSQDPSRRELDADQQARGRAAPRNAGTDRLH